MTLSLQQSTASALLHPHLYARAQAEGAPQRASVCHLISGDRWAGAESQAAGLLRALSDRQDVQVSAIVLNEGRLAEELRHMDIEVSVIPEDQNSFREILSKAERILRQQQPEVLHSHRYKENLLSLLLARRCGVPFTVRTQHGFPEPFQGLSNLRHTALQLLDRVTGRLWADLVIGVSTEMMPRLRCTYGRRAVRVRNGIDLSAVHSTLSREQARIKLGLPASAPVIGLVGRLEPIKRGDLFLHSASLFKQDVPEAHFVIVGSGSQKHLLKHQAATAGLGDCTHFLGHREDVYDVLKALDVLVICSDHEGLPIGLLEALWLGVPVVARGVGGILEVLGNDDCGLVTTSSPEHIAHACHRILHDSVLRGHLRRNAERRVFEEYSLPWSADGVVYLYRELILKGQMENA